MFDAALAHDGETIGEGERFLLIVGDVDGGDRRCSAEPADLGAHVVPQFGVEVGEWFVEEEDVGLDGERAGERDALLLAAGELSGLALGVLVHLDEGEGFGGALAALGAGEFALAQAELDVLEDGHVRPEGVGLEDHADAAFFGWESGDVAVGEVDGAGCRFGEAGEHAEDGGFAAAGRA